MFRYRTCHRPCLLIDNPVIQEPTPDPNYRGTGPFAGLIPTTPLAFDLTRDGPLPRFERTLGGMALVRLFSDLKRHNMGASTSLRPARAVALTLAGFSITRSTALARGGVPGRHQEPDRSTGARGEDGGRSILRRGTDNTTRDEREAPRGPHGPARTGRATDVSPPTGGNCAAEVVRAW